MEDLELLGLLLSEQLVVLLFVVRRLQEADLPALLGVLMIALLPREVVGVEGLEIEMVPGGHFSHCGEEASHSVGLFEKMEVEVVPEARCSHCGEVASPLVGLLVSEHAEPLPPLEGLTL